MSDSPKVERSVVERSKVERSKVERPEADLLYSFEQVHNAIRNQATAINQHLFAAPPETPLVVIAILHGAVVYSGLLLPELEMPLEFDTLRATRYGDKTTGSSTIQWLQLPTVSLAGKQVLLLDDIFDEGKTLEAVDAWAKEQGAAKVFSAVMLDKQHHRKPVQFRPTFSAITVADRYVFGMGMDYQNLWRNTRGIWALKT